MEITQTKVLLCWYTSFIYQTFIIALLMYNVMVKKNLLILIFVFLISTRDLNKFMSEFDVLKFIVHVMEHMQFINTFNMTKDVNVFVYTLCSIVHLSKYRRCFKKEAGCMKVNKLNIRSS